MEMEATILSMATQIAEVTIAWFLSSVWMLALNLQICIRFLFSWLVFVLLGFCFVGFLCVCLFLFLFSVLLFLFCLFLLFCLFVCFVLFCF